MIKLLFLALLMSCAVGVSAQPSGPVLALVIDDLGYSKEAAEAAFALPGNNTFAIIPDSAQSFWTAITAQNQELETILHLPMQSGHNHVAAENNTLNINMSEEEFIAQVQYFLQQLPGVRGVNNHMGSLLTEQGWMMRPLMQTIHDTNPSLVFLDSRTSPDSQALTAALEAGLPATRRDVFLDHEPTEEAIEFQFKRWLSTARKYGHALAIAHPHPLSIQILQQEMPQAIEQGYRFVTLSEYIDEIRSQEQWPRYLSHWQTDSKNSKP